MPTPPASTKTSLGQRLNARARERWTDLARLDVRFRGRFAYVDGRLPDGEVLPLCRLRYGGSASAGALRFTAPATTTTRTTICPTETPPAAPRKPSTARAASTSTTPPPGGSPIHGRTNRQDH
jgi:hypothetical protein